MREVSEALKQHLLEHSVGGKDVMSECHDFGSLIHAKAMGIKWEPTDYFLLPIHTQEQHKELCDWFMGLKEGREVGYLKWEDMCVTISCVVNMFPSDVPVEFEPGCLATFHCDWVEEHAVIESQFKSLVIVRCQEENVVRDRTGHFGQINKEYKFPGRILYKFSRRDNEEVAQTESPEQESEKGAGPV